MRNNASVYDLRENIDYQLIHSDFLKLSESYSGEIKFPEGNQQFDAVFLSPPWGGSGYNLLPEYNLEHIYPEFNKIIQKSVKYSENLMLFLPRNTSISDLVNRLAKHHTELIGDRRKTELCDFLGEEDPLELTIEIEQLKYGNNVTALLVYTGDLARIEVKEVVAAFLDLHCQNKFQVEA
jgi:hypothetical protein